MKKIEDLGISQAPWKCATDDNGEVIGIENGRGFYVARFAVDVKPNDARLISAAPRLYDCLREAALDKCTECDSESCDRCRVNKWIAALSDAAGESEVKDGE